MLVYCDSVILIYYLDHIGSLQARAADRLRTIHEQDGQLAISDLTRFECRVGPIKRGDAQMLAAFDHFFASPDIHVVPLTAEVWDKAAEIRATLGLKTADSLHLAAAIAGKCDVLLTNDLQLNRCTEVKVEVLM